VSFVSFVSFVFKSFEPIVRNQARRHLAMRIATFNINNVVKRLPNLLAWLEAARPDVVCLQELKCADAAFPAAAIAEAGYSAVWAGQRTWNGVAILARGAEPVVTRWALPGDEADVQARYVEAAVRGVLIASLYAPNGNPNPGPKFAYKLAWLRRLIAHAAELRAAGVPVVLAGDYNVVPTPADIYQPNSWKGDALVDPAARALYADLLTQGWTDALALAHSSPAAKTTGEGDHAKHGGGGAAHPPWTFWSYLRRRWDNDKGLRIDHLLLTPDLAARLTATGVDRWPRGEAGASDHAPTWVEISD
jgi:exodeoxyribonuclease III